MAGIQKVPLRIPAQWSPEWFETFVREVLSKLDTRNSVGVGVAVTSDGNSVATLNATTAINAAVDAHNADAAANPVAIAAHSAVTTDVHAAADYAQTDVAETITEPWTFNDKVNVFAGQGGGWRDMLGQIVVPTVGVGSPVWTQLGASVFYGWKFAVNDSVQVIFHIQHDYTPDTDIYLHTHWTTDGTSTNAVKWQFTWTYAKGYNQANFDVAGGGTTKSVSLAAAGTAWRHMISEVADADVVPGTGIEVDGLLIVNIKRITNGGAENADGVYLEMSDGHYRADAVATKNRNGPDFYT